MSPCLFVGLIKNVRPVFLFLVQDSRRRRVPSADGSGQETEIRPVLHRRRTPPQPQSAGEFTEPGRAQNRLNEQKENEPWSWNLFSLFSSLTCETVSRTLWRERTSRTWFWTRTQSGAASCSQTETLFWEAFRNCATPQVNPSSGLTTNVSLQTKTRSSSPDYRLD